MVKEIKSFEEFKLNKQLLNAIADLGYETPTLIQQQAIPRIQAGHDVMGIAQTGTGKTAAFVLPILMKVKYAQGMHPRALILAPTRELVMQIHENVKQLSTYTDLRAVCLYGGIGPKGQIEAVEKGVDIIIATPGRFLDLYFREVLILKDIKTLVLDEADKMMDMGFMPQIRNILEVIPVKRQNLLFSATMPPKVVKLSEEFLEFPEVIEITPQATAVETVTQQLYQVPNLRTKINLLMLLLKNPKFSKVIVFVKTKVTANNIFKFLDRKLEDEIRVIHANKGQNSRINAIEAFKQDEVRILVTTDVTARGIDVSEVSHVINFDVPLIYEDYVHRIGRTGRALRTGEALTFVNEAEMYHIHKIEEIIREKIPEVPLPAELEITETPFEERQAIAREIDRQKHRENPDYQGAFHEKKERKASSDKALQNRKVKSSSQKKYHHKGKK
jgi:ATP-dependent RNA helicase RhlE